MTETSPLPDFAAPSALTLDLDAADRVMICGKVGLRAYAEAGGLDPAADFRGLDLRGWDLAGQDLAGFDLSGCNLRDTGIEFAHVGTDTLLDGAIWDDAIEPGDRVGGSVLTHADLAALVERAGSLHDRNETKPLAATGQTLLPLLESLFGPDDPKILLLAGYVGFGEVRNSAPAAGRARLQATLDRLRAAGALETDWQILLWRFYSAEALLTLGRAAEALAEVEALLPLDEAVRGARDPSTLTTHHMKARALLDLGRAADALAEVEALLPLDEAVRGARDPGTLATRYMKARALLDLGRAADALAEVEALLPLEEAVRGARDPNTLTTRHMKARALLDLGRAAEALAEFEALLPLEEAVRGARDPGTLTTRYMKARALLDLGRAAEALAEFGLVAAGYQVAKGENHLWVSIIRTEEIGSRMALGETGFTADLRRLADHIARDLYPHNPAVLRTRYRRARCLIAEGKPDEARAEIAVLLALCEHAGVAQYRYVKATRRLLAGLDGDDDGVGLPF